VRCETSLKAAGELDRRRWLGAVSGATTLALAAVLGLAAVVAGLAATLPLAVVFGVSRVLALVLVLANETNARNSGIGRGDLG
jgi:hypothetical protein